MMATILHSRVLTRAALAASFIAVTALRASAQSYTLSRESAPYHDLQGATAASIDIGDTVRDHFLDLGESFSFFRRPRTLRDSLTLRITGFGNLRIDDDTSMVIIDGIFGELVPRDARSGISYLVEGTPGDRVVKVQWKNVGFRNGTPADSANVQIWLHQKSGVVEIRLGPGSVQKMEEVGGWMGAFISPPDFRYMIEKAWIVGDPGKPAFDTRKNFTFGRLTALPPSGTIFRLTPTGSLGVETKRKPTGALQILPNPATDRTELLFGGELRRDACIRLFDLLGRSVGGMVLDPDSRALDLSGVPSGTYLVELVNGAERYAGMIAKR